MQIVGKQPPFFLEDHIEGIPEGELFVRLNYFMSDLHNEENPFGEEFINFFIDD